MNEKDWVKSGYEKRRADGRPICRPSGRKGKAPTFVVWAVKDPTSGNLDRIQIVKGWSKSGQSFEKVYDVAWAGDRKPDTWTGGCRPSAARWTSTKATYTNTIGSVELKAVWTDPDFDPSLHAFYYARVLEIPTPRWTPSRRSRLGIAAAGRRAAYRAGARLASPIWYTPGADARKTAPAGTDRRRT